MKSQIPDTSKIGKLYLLNGEVKTWEGSTTPITSPICYRDIAPDSEDGTTLDTRVYLGEIPNMTEEHAMVALDAAVSAWDKGKGEWPSMPIQARIEATRKFVSILKEQRSEVIQLLMWEIGKSYKDSIKEFDRTIDYINDTLDALAVIDSENRCTREYDGIAAQILRTPLGVCLSMGPFNYPLNETYTTLIPALVMGNTLVVKPPKYGVLLHQPILKAFAEAFPPGVVNFIYGDGATIISPIMKSGKIDVLAFIGSCKVADILKKQHPHPHRLRCILGLDAKNPAIILPDADLEHAAKECITGALSFNGQRCTALKILFVHESIAAEFVAKVSDGVQKLKKGLPWDEDVQITPLAEENKVEKLQELIQDAICKGAHIVNAEGGTNKNTLVHPAVMFPTSADAKLYTVEQFGPIIPICTYKSTEEFLDFVVNSNFGQQISIFGNDQINIRRLTSELINQVSRININSQCQRGPDILPFTGRKDSAEGTLSITDALRCFSIRAVIAKKANS